MNDIDQQIRQVLDEYSRAPAGAHGLRRIGTGPNDAAPGNISARATSVLSDRTFAAPPVMAGLAGGGLRGTYPNPEVVAENASLVISARVFGF